MYTYTHTHTHIPIHMYVYTHTHTPAQCSDKPRLPSSGFDYNVNEMTRLLSLPLSELFAEHPGCGGSQLVVASNSAARFGGGLYQAECDVGLQQVLLFLLFYSFFPLLSFFVAAREVLGSGGKGGEKPGMVMCIYMCVCMVCVHVHVCVYAARLLLGRWDLE